MLFLSHFLTYTCFPCLIIYKHLPGNYFSSATFDVELITKKVAMIGLINIGIFLISYSIAVLISNKKFRQDEDVIGSDWSLRPKLMFSLIFGEVICTVIVLFVTLYHNEQRQKSVMEIVIQIIGIIALIVLAFLHGLIATHFITWRPPKVNNDKQPQAYAQRDYVRHLGTCLGIMVQLTIIYMFQPCFYAY